MQLISGQGLPVDISEGQEAGQPGVDHVELHVWVGAAVGGARAGPLAPAVADEPFGQGELAFGEHLPQVDVGAAHDEGQCSRIAR